MGRGPPAPWQRAKPLGSRPHRHPMQHIGAPSLFFLLWRRPRGAPRCTLHFRSLPGVQDPSQVCQPGMPGAAHQTSVRDSALVSQASTPAKLHLSLCPRCTSSNHQAFALAAGMPFFFLPLTQALGRPSRLYPQLRRLGNPVLPSKLHNPDTAVLKSSVTPVGWFFLCFPK